MDILVPECFPNCVAFFNHVSMTPFLHSNCYSNTVAGNLDNTLIVLEDVDYCGSGGVPH